MTAGARTGGPHALSLSYEEPWLTKLTVERSCIDKNVSYSDVYKKRQLPIKPAIGDWLHEPGAHPYRGILCSH